MSTESEKAFEEAMRYVDTDCPAWAPTIRAYVEEFKKERDEARLEAINLGRGNTGYPALIEANKEIQFLRSKLSALRDRVELAPKIWTWWDTGLFFCDMGPPADMQLVEILRECHAVPVEQEIHEQ